MSCGFAGADGYFFCYFGSRVRVLDYLNYGALVTEHLGGNFSISTVYEVSEDKDNELLL